LHLLSKLPLGDKLEFILNAYDFDGSQELSIDEVTLAMKSTLTGLCKMSRDRMPREEELEVKAMHCFEDALGEEEAGGSGGKVYIGRVIEWAENDPEVRSWLEYFDDVPERDWQIYPMQRHELDFEAEGEHPRKTPQQVANLDSDPFAFTSPANATMAAQGWTTSIASLHPTAHAATRPDLSVPDSGLELEWVHGYRSEDCKSNVRYAASGEMVWPASRVCVLYNALEHKQRFFLGHAAEVTAIVMHPNKRLVATGDAGERPTIIVWDTETLKAVATLSGFHTHSVEQLAFSADGARLVAVGGDASHSLSVYSWAARKRIFAGSCGSRKVLDVCFGEGDSVVSCGVNHIHFWVKEGAQTVKRRGVFGQTGKVQALTSLAPCGANMLSGTVDGHIYVWLGRNCMRSIRAHAGCVNTLSTSPHGIVSGGKDRKVKLWTLSLEAGATFDMSAFGSNPSVRSATLSHDGTRLLVATKGSEVFEISAADGSDLQGGPITAGHYAGKVRAVAVHPMKPEFATVGDDGTLRIWDIYTRNLVKSTVFDVGLRCISYHPNGDLILVGLGGPLGGQPSHKKHPVKTKKDGAFVVLNEPDLTVTYEARDSKLPLTACKFSPDGEYMAVASEDASVYLYSCSEDYESIGKCRRHTGPVRRFDFSEDSKYLQTSGDDRELFFFNAGTAQAMGNLGAMKDVNFPPQSVPFGWGTAGAFSPMDDGSDVLCSGRSFSGNVLATGDNFGNLKLFRYPCWSLGAASHEFRAHGGRLGDVAFTNEDSHLITCGEDDRSLMQWRHKEVSTCYTHATSHRNL
jgi:microtubule-associated protein-like 6